MKNQKIVCLLIMVVMISSLVSCGESKTIINYADAESFESALNSGENLEGKRVQFVGEELIPNSAYGYNIWAEEHFNFASSRNPDVKKGDTVVVKTTTIESISGSWIIRYEKV